MSRNSRRPSAPPDGSELHTLRDELRVRLHLASREAKQQWENIETKLLNLERQLERHGDGARTAASELTLAVARTFRDFMARHLPDGGPSRAPVHDVMRVRVHTCQPGDTLARAAQLMWEKDVGCLPVVAEGRKATAMITDRDICMASFTQWVHLENALVSSAMSRALISCSPDEPISAAEELMRRYQVRRLAVLDAEGVLVGLISIGDIARYLRSHTSPGSVTTSQAELADTLAAICEPRFASMAPPPKNHAPTDTAS
jgi:CBS domain-containing protein